MSKKAEFYVVESPITHKLYVVRLTTNQVDAYKRRRYSVTKL